MPTTEPKFWYRVATAGDPTLNEIGDWLAACHHAGISGDAIACDPNGDPILGLVADGEALPVAEPTAELPAIPVMPLPPIRED